LLSQGRHIQRHQDRRQQQAGGQQTQQGDFASRGKQQVGQDQQGAPGSQAQAKKRTCQGNTQQAKQE